ncbi:MAG TPA: putative PEP-binding protein [Leptolyngbyaceae cyanobacterium]
MALFRVLDPIVNADMAEVGEKALLLSRLHQQSFSVVPGSILGAVAWETCLDQVLQGELAPLADLTSLPLENFLALQSTASTLRQALLNLPLALEMTSFLPQTEAAWLIVRSSLSLNQPMRLWSPENGLGLIPARLCPAEPAALATALKQLWADSLRAQNLIIWQRFCQSLRQVRLATLIQPLYAAQVSGTLILEAQASHLEAVLGLGLALSQGEAIPARCRISQRVAVPHWQPGYQERIYWLRNKSHGRSSDFSSEGIFIQHRDPPELSCPLTATQVEELLHLGRRVRAQWGQAVRLEWILHNDTQTGKPAIAITQITPWTELLTSDPSPAPSVSLELSSPASPPHLNQISLVVQGIGAAPGKVLAPAVVIPAGNPDIDLPSGCIVVLTDLQPEFCIQLQSVAGIVTVRGGTTCHAAILARELNIPAMVGAPHATELLSTGDFLWLDGDRGVVYVVPDAATAPPLPNEAPANPSPAYSWLSEPESISVDAKSTQTQVMVNLSQASRLTHLPLDQIDGVGLLRSEWLLIDALEGRHPQQWVEAGLGADLQARIVEKLTPILAALAPKPVRYRSLDLRFPTPQLGQASLGQGALQAKPVIELNPMLGVRGTFSYQLDPRLFELELAALAELQRRGHTNLQLMLPFVRTVEEFSACRQWVERAGLFQSNGFQLWIMAEVPSVLFLLPAYRQAGVQGIAIGTNDLTQLILAVDRDQPAMASAYDDRHPAVLAALAHLIQTARQEQLTCSICGQAPVRHPELIESLVQWGIHSISVEAGAIATTRRAILAAEQKQWH